MSISSFAWSFWLLGFVIGSLILGRAVVADLRSAKSSVDHCAIDATRAKFL